MSQRLAVAVALLLAASTAGCSDVREPADLAGIPARDAGALRPAAPTPSIVVDAASKGPVVSADVYGASSTRGISFGIRS